MIDPGHGGADAGVRGANGAKEKDVTLQVARRLKSAIEARIGLRVLLTRDADEDVPVDRRTAFANNNKADLFISLHANASFQMSTRGTQVVSLNLDDYKDRAGTIGRAGVAVPTIGGGTRLVDPVPWDLAQIPYADRSAALATLVVRKLNDAGVPMFVRPADQEPLRILVGANMPAVLVELGFLSNPDDERALSGDDLPATIVNALVGVVADVRHGLPGAASGGR